MRRAHVIWRSVLTLVIAGGLSPGGLPAADYYVSSSTGDDTAAGTSETTAWKSLSRASQAQLRPGDQLLLKSGDVFQGTLTLDTRGAAGHPIRVSRFGTGRRPNIDGAGQEACVRLVNPAYIVVEQLELTNPKGLYGVRLTAQDAGELRSVLIQALEISQIYQKAWDEPEDSGHGEFKYYGGINAQVLRGERPSWWDGLTTRDCDLHDLGTCGISIGSSYPLHEKRRQGRRGVSDPYPIKNAVIERNRFRDIARDGAIVRQCDGAVLQFNDVMRTGRVSISNGIWFWDCRNSTIRANIGRHCLVRGKVDGGPFSIDYFCDNCTIEDNYSHDNEGPAFMVFGNSGTGQGSVVRGNVSYNDGTAASRPGFAAVSMISTVSGTVVEGNTVIAGPDTRVLLGHHYWQGMPQEVVYRHNIFVGNGAAHVEPSVLVGGRFEKNLFVNVPTLPEGILSDAQGFGEAFLAAQRRHADIQRTTGVDAAGNP